MKYEKNLKFKNINSKLILVSNGVLIDKDVSILSVFEVRFNLINISFEKKQ